MPFHTVLTPPAARAGSATEQAEKTVFLKDGFSFAAFLFTGLWLAYKRLWLPLLAFAVVWAAIGFGGRQIGISPLGLAIAQGLIGLFLGLEGHALIERKLIAKGWRFAGVVEGRDIDMVERRYFETKAPLPEPAPSPTPFALQMQPQQQGQGVLGLFPEARGR